MYLRLLRITQTVHRSPSRPTLLLTFAPSATPTHSAVRSSWPGSRDTFASCCIRARQINNLCCLYQTQSRTQNKHAEQTDKEGPQIKSGRERERGRAAGERQRQTVKRSTISCCCHRQVAGAAVSSDAGETGQGNGEQETMTGRGGVQGGEGGLHNW